MKHFLRMIELSRMNPSHKDFKFWSESFKMAQPFVFQDSLDLGDSRFQDESVISNFNSLLDLPFECCSFEGLRPNSLVFDGEPHFSLNCVLVREVAPKVYRFFVYTENHEDSTFMLREVKDNVQFKGVLEVLRAWLEKLNSQDCGTESVKIKVKIGSGSTKEHHTIRQVIRVMPKKERLSALPLFSRSIDWSHRFHVRGHWRKIAGLGKNREGVYCVSGFTWVSDFIKGDESKPLIQKVRVV